MIMWFVVVEPGTSNQLLTKPTLIELVCACKRQPVWSCGQLKSSELPTDTRVMLVRVVLIPLATRSLPSEASVFVFQTRFGPGVAGTRLVNKPSRKPAE